ncbi:hypothetical protein PR202_gb24154 [Eleusine coracana subsp. coracana]|uniref:Uncharacterized protein n=1 Tax=Eleusine coracana subsp. coracana TaxID=191504 RepID=A0AAV5FI21_ELECO|nr:hypothetical protein PR202_gb24154 [Eleusine coracana subsp. coracana]
MSCQDHSSPPWYPNSSEDRKVTMAGDRSDEGFFEMFGDRSSTGDLFELVWQGRGGGGNSSMDQVHHCLPLPPSEEEMATWLYPIVRGEVEPVTTSMDQPACGDIVDGRNAALKTEVKCIECLSANIFFLPDERKRLYYEEETSSRRKEISPLRNTQPHRKGNGHWVQHEASTSGCQPHRTDTGRCQRWAAATGHVCSGNASERIGSTRGSSCTG